MTRLLIGFILILGALARGGDVPTFHTSPNPIGAISRVLEASGIDRLTPRLYYDNGRRFAYRFEGVRVLGFIQRESQRFMLVTALFTRSATENSWQATPKGHGFLLCFTDKFDLVGHCHLDDPAVRLEGSLLLRGDDQIADFTEESELIRRDGFLIDGDDFLPYPYLDRLPNKTEEGEQAGAGEPATRSESDVEGGDKPKPEAEGRSR